MSNDVKFHIKLLIDGKERIVDATTAVKELEEVFQSAKGEAGVLRDQLLKYTHFACSEVLGPPPAIHRKHIAMVAVAGDFLSLNDIFSRNCLVVMIFVVFLQKRKRFSSYP